MSKKHDAKEEVFTKRIEELENQAKRSLADYQNLEKRMASERSEWIAGANRDLLLRLLPVLDTLVLAARHSEDGSLQVSVGQFLDVLKNEGVKQIKTEGEEFNPQTMECVTTQAGEENKVVTEVRSGYMLNGKILRPAQVIVGKETN
jgi:molecular chaperone GrpE